MVLGNVSAIASDCGEEEALTRRLPSNAPAQARVFQASGKKAGVKLERSGKVFGKVGGVVTPGVDVEFVRDAA